MGFSFLNTGLLAAAIAALVPLALHLLRRRAARDDFLPTLQFLKAGFAANRRRMRLRHLLVLALRVLAVLLIVATLARPAYMGAFFSRKGTSAVSAVIVLDNSASMAYEETRARRYDRAKKLVSDVLDGLPGGSRARLVVTGLGPRGETLDRDFAFRAAAVKAAAESTEISAYGGDCVSALKRAYASLDEEAAGDVTASREVYVVSDLAANAWAGFRGIEPPARTATFILDVGAEKNENFHVETVSATWRSFPPPPHVAITTEVSAGGLAAGRLLEVHLSGAKRAERLLQMNASSTETERFEVPVLEGSGGVLQGWVALPDRDPVRADNTRYFTMPRSRDLKCLVVSGSSGEADSAFYVSNALEPEGLTGATGVSVSVEPGETLKLTDLDNADVIILAEAGNLDERLWEAVERSADGGKGVVVFLGSETPTEGCKAFLGRHFGVKTGPVKEAASNDMNRFEVLSYDHPMLAAFAGGRNGNLSAAKLHKWRSITPTGPGGAKAGQLARVSGSDSLLMSAPVGAGRAVLAAFAPRRDWTDLVLRAPFVPLMHETVTYAAGVRADYATGATGFDVGSAVTFPIEQSAEALEVEVATPLDNKPAKVTIPPGENRFLYRAFFPGNYVVNLPVKNGAGETGFSVNIPSAESAGMRVAPEDLAKGIRGSVVVRDLSARSIKRAWGTTRGARELFDIFLVVAVAVLVLEEYLANRFYREAADGGNA